MHDSLILLNAINGLSCLKLGCNCAIWLLLLLLLLQSPVDGKPMLLTPEESIQIQVNVASLFPFWVINDVTANF